MCSFACILAILFNPTRFPISMSCFCGQSLHRCFFQNILQPEKYIPPVLQCLLSCFGTTWVHEIWKLMADWLKNIYWRYGIVIANKPGLHQISLIFIFDDTPQQIILICRDVARERTVTVFLTKKCLLINKHYNNHY